MAPGLPAKNSVFVLKGNNVDAGFVQELSRFNIFVGIFGLNFELHGLRIIIDPPGVCHHYDAGLKIWTGRRNRPMKIIGKGGDPTTARKMIADKRYSLN